MYKSPIKNKKQNANKSSKPTIKSACLSCRNFYLRKYTVSGLFNLNINDLFLVFINKVYASYG